MRTMYKNQGQGLESKNDTAGKGGVEPKGGVSEERSAGRSFQPMSNAHVTKSCVMDFNK